MKRITCFLLVFLSVLLMQAQVIIVSSVARNGSAWLNVADSDAAVIFPSASSSAHVDVDANVDYQCSTDADWLKVTVADGGVEVSATENTGAGVREAAVEIVAKDNLNQTVIVRQLGSAPAILVKESSVELAENDNLTFTLDVCSNIGVTISVPEWISTSSADITAGEHKVEFVADRLEEERSQRSGVITFAAANGAAEPVKVNVTHVFSGYPRFAVISDTHFGNNWDEGPLVKVPKAINNILSHSPRVDAIFICGDLTDWGTPAQFDLFKSVFDNPAIVPADLPVYVMMGNHDNYADNALQNYLVLDQPYHRLVDIKGYPFITTSMNGGGWDDYAPEEIEALGENLRIASEKYPGKPIFVFTHVPPMNTVYGTCEGEGGWGSNVLTSTLSKYPQTVVFGGHSHFPLADPRSIHQGVFTTINDGSTTYSEIEPGVVNEGIHPYRAGFVTEGCIVNVDKDMNVEIERWDTYRNEEILPRWNVKAPHDGSQFVYTNARTGGSAPKWNAGSRVVVSDVKGETCVVTFPQAVDDENVHHYEVEIIDAESGEVKSQGGIFSSFYLNSETPAELSMTMNRVPSGATLIARVRALDSYKNKSTDLDSAPFVTEEYQPAPGSSAPKADLFDVAFGDGNSATDISGRNVEILTGEQTPSTRFSEELNRWVATFTGNSQNFYRINYNNDTEIKNALTNGFSLECLYKSNDISNSCPLSGQESGGAGIEQAGNGELQFFCHVGGGYKTIKTGVKVEAGQFYHVVVTYDSEAKKTAMYINGSLSGELEAAGSFGFPSDSNAHWFGIGGDANPGGYVQFTLDGEVAIARMYSHAVDRDEVYWLHKDVEDRKVEYQPAPGTSAPKADLFDVEFGEGGVATDVSSRHVEVKTGSTTPVTQFNDELNRWTASFTGTGSQHYRVDYAADEEIKNALTNGFSLEVLYSTDNLSNVCPLSAQEGGGAGIEQASGGQLQFYCHVGGGYKVIKSNVTVETGRFYHVVVVYDKDAEKTRMYVDGEFAGEMAAAGSFGFPSDSAAHWFAIGGDAHTGTNAQYALEGEIAFARMYAHPVTRDEVYWLYKGIRP